MAAGTVTLQADNTGKEAHELVVVGDVEAFPAGQRCSGTFALAAGRYALFCNRLETAADGTRQNHYANGIRAGFEVRG